MYTIAIEQDGSLTFVHSDQVAAMLAPLGQVTIKRASHVEPNEQAQWEADMSPSGGETLGPFPTRTQALSAEVEWLNKKLF
jgi:hypothetical protein